jgi:cysteinyl-tRNA synthetase
VFEWVRDVNRALDAGRASAADRAGLQAVLDAFDAVYDVLRPDPAERTLEAGVEALIAEREAARGARDWQRADALRDRLAELGIVLEDTPAGPRWKRSTGT